MSNDREPLNDRRPSRPDEESTADAEGSAGVRRNRTQPIPADTMPADTIAAETEGKVVMDASSTDRAPRTEPESASGGSQDDPPRGQAEGSAANANSADERELGIDEPIVDEPEIDEPDREPLELIQNAPEDEEFTTNWYILKVQVNREDSIRDALQRRVKIEGLDRYFNEIVVPTEDVAEFTKTGKRRIIKRKLYPGYIMVNMHINDDTWFLVRETPGIGDFTGSAGKPTPMDPREVERIRNLGKTADEGDTHVKTAIPFKQGDRVRVKDGYFQNFEGDVESVDEANGRVTVMINIFGRSTPVELEHWQIEAV